MKKVLLLLAASAFVLSCNRLAENEFEITGTVDKSLDGKNIILEKQGGYMGFIPVDTAVVQNGKFKFKGTVTEPSLHFLTIVEPQKKVDLILENGAIEMVIDNDSIQKSERKGTFNNEKLQEFYKSMEDVKKRSIAFQKKNEQAMMLAMQTKDTVTSNRLRKEYMKFGTEIEKQNTDFINKNTNAFVTVLLIKQMASSGRIPLADVKKYYNALSADMKKTKEGKEIAEAIAKAEAPAAPGKPAPDFTAPTPDGKKISLRESMGKVTIIDFWASWCGPCRKENPNVVALYNDFHAKGLNIIGVSLDKPSDADKWKAAIVADKLAWTQVSNLMGWEDPVAKQYGVKSIPATFILDAKGNIVATDLRGAELRAKVNELLKS